MLKNLLQHPISQFSKVKVFRTPLETVIRIFIVQSSPAIVKQAPSDAPTLCQYQQFHNLSVLQCGCTTPFVEGQLHY